MDINHTKNNAKVYRIECQVQKMCQREVIGKNKHISCEKN